MAEENASQENAAQQQEQPQGKPDTTDWKAEARKWEDRAKANKAAADELEALKKEQREKEESAKTDLEKAIAKAEKASSELAEMKAAQQRADLVKKTARDYKVDEDLLTLMVGNTEDEIEANAKALKAKFDALPKYPNVNDKGESSGSSKLTKKEILAIKNPKEQLRVAAQNLDAFN